MTAQDVVDSVSIDVRQQLNSDSDSELLLDWVDRTQKAILRYSNWPFMQSDEQRFVTEKGQTDYWIGSSAAPTGMVDTLLALSDVKRVVPKTVFDRTNNKELFPVKDEPALGAFENPDGTAKLDRPRVFRNTSSNPNILSIYPAPDNQNNYQPIPATPQVTSTASGALAARVYYIQITLVDEMGGESLPSLEVARQFIAANHVLQVLPPRLPFTRATSGVGYTQYNVYVGTEVNSLTLQNNSPVSTDDSWTEPDSGLVAGDAPPSENTLESIEGYVIEFKYTKTRPTVDDLADTLVIPSDYQDVVANGVVAYASSYLKRLDEASRAYALLQAGLREMVRDYNGIPANQDFCKPDSVAVNIGSFTNYIDPSGTFFV